jgi:hypothetical protein
MIRIVPFIMCALVAASLPAFGQQVEGAGITMGLMKELSFDDNILRQPNDVVSSRILRVNPNVGYVLEQRGRVLGMSYDYANFTYLDSRTDDYDSHKIDFNVDQHLGRSHKISVLANLLSSSEGRGIGFNEGQNALALDGPTDIDTRALTGNYELGAADAPMRLIATLGVRSTDRDSPVIINDSRDYREDLWGGQMLYKLGWRIDLAAELRNRDISYDRNPVDADGSELFLDSTETQNLLGIDLRASAKTTAKLRVGTTKRDFRWKGAQWDGAPASEPVEELPVPAPALAPAPQDSGSDLFWEITGIWAPRTYSTFSFDSSITTREAVSVGYFIRSQEHRLAWSHRWSGWAQSEVDLTYGTDDYIGTSRVDQRRAMNLRMLYMYNASTNFGLGIRHQRLDSQFENLGFDKRVYYLFFNWTDQRAGQE